jgi:fatty acid synthase subunit alpha
MRSIFPTTIDGDLLKLVHLSNGFRMVDEAKPLQVGDMCYSKARIASVTNTAAGKIVKVKGHVYRASTPVIEVVSAFLYRGRFTDYENTFEITEEPDYLVNLLNDASVGVLQSKEWFEWDDQSVPLQAGTALFFRVQPQVTYKDKTSNVSVSGDRCVPPWHNYTRYMVERRYSEVRRECGCKRSPRSNYCISSFK